MNMGGGVMSIEAWLGTDIIGVIGFALIGGWFWYCNDQDKKRREAYEQRRIEYFNKTGYWV